MGTIRSYETKRGERRYMIDYYVPKDISDTGETKKVVKRGFKTQKAAKEALRDRETWLEDGSHDEKIKRKRWTFDHLITEYTKIYKTQASWEHSKKYMVRKLAEDFSGQLLISISYHTLQKYRAELKATPKRIIKHKGQADRAIYRSDATVNRYMALLQHMLEEAVMWEALPANPFKKGKSLRVGEEARERFLDAGEIEFFLKHCKVSHIADFFIVAVNTGMDKGEILRLKWEQIKHNKIYCPKVKTRRKREIPISPDLAEHLAAIRSRKVASKYVICDARGKRLKDVKRGFKTVCRRAGIHDFRIKDLRHTFASHFVMRTRDMKTLQEILGHTTPRMTSRYAHLIDAHKEEQMAKMGGLTNGNPKSRTLLELFARSDKKKGLNENR